MSKIRPSALGRRMADEQQTLSYKDRIQTRVRITFGQDALYAIVVNNQVRLETDNNWGGGKPTGVSLSLQDLKVLREVLDDVIPELEEAEKAMVAEQARYGPLTTASASAGYTYVQPTKNDLLNAWIGKLAGGGTK